LAIIAVFTPVALNMPKQPSAVLGFFGVAGYRYDVSVVATLGMKGATILCPIKKTIKIDDI